jgi:hypothetical protein
MRESELEKEIKQAEEVYEGLLQTRRSLGSMLAQTIRRGRDLDEFGRHMRDLPGLIRQADLRRTELRRELLDRRARWAEDEYRRAAEELSKAARALDQARSAYVKAEETATRSGLEARWLAEARDKEAKHLQELLRVPVDVQRSQVEHQRGEQDAQREETRGEGQGTQKHWQQGEERSHAPSQVSGDVRATSGASITVEDAK